MKELRFTLFLLLASVFLYSCGGNGYKSAYFGNEEEAMVFLQTGATQANASCPVDQQNFVITHVGFDASVWEEKYDLSVNNPVVKVDYEAAKKATIALLKESQSRKMFVDAILTTNSTIRYIYYLPNGEVITVNITSDELK